MYLRLLDEKIASSFLPGYTLGMKTAVSIPDDVFERAERLARRAKRSRSRLYADALGEYLARHENDEITEAMNAVVAEAGQSVDPFVVAVGVGVLGSTDW